MVGNTIERALATGGSSSIAAVMVLARWEQRTGGLAMSARQRLHRLVRSLDQHQGRMLAPLASMYPDGPLQALVTVAPLPKAKPGLLGNRVRKHVHIASLAEDSKQRTELLLERLNRVQLVLQDQRSTVYDLDHKDGPPDDGGALADPAVQEVIVTAGIELTVRDWQAAGKLYGVLANWTARQPVGEQPAQPL
jgi:ornithine cyclodeaminase/alanine dehydrogenase-like protein (mu-crystallin family)